MNKRENKIEWKDDKMIVTIRSGKVYELEEQSDKVVTKCRKAAEINKKNGRETTIDVDEDVMNEMLLIKSCVKPILKESEFDLTSLPGSEAMALRKAIQDLYDLEIFLR